jgi:hypothetical protein
VENSVDLGRKQGTGDAAIGRAGRKVDRRYFESFYPKGE